MNVIHTCFYISRSTTCRARETTYKHYVLRSFLRSTAYRDSRLCRGLDTTASRFPFCQAPNTPNTTRETEEKIAYS